MDASIMTTNISSPALPRFINFGKLFKRILTWPLFLGYGLVVVLLVTLILSGYLIGIIFISLFLEASTHLFK
jgi:hypothetical protein